MPARHFTTGLTAALLIACAAATPAEAQIKTPDCATLGRFLQGVDLGDRHQLNRWTVYAISKAFLGDAWMGLYGKPAMKLTQAEVAAIRQGADACEKAASKAKDRTTARTFALFKTEVQKNLGPILAMIEKAEPQLDPAIDKLASYPPSMDMLNVVVSIREFVKTGDDRLVRGNYGGRIDRNMEKDLQAVFTLLRQLPQEVGPQRLPPKIDPLYAPSRDMALKGEIEKLEAVPMTVGGLRDLDRSLRGAKGTFGKLLAPEELAVLDEAAAKRRTAIHDHLVADGKGKIDAMPANFSTLTMLSRSGPGPYANGLPPERVKDIEAHIAARKEAIADAVLQSSIEDLPKFPPTFEGITELANYQQGFRQKAGPLVGPERVQKLDAAVKDRAQEIAKEALPQFRKRVDELPETRAGIAELDRLAHNLVPTIGRIDLHLVNPFSKYAEERRAKLVAAVEAEEKRLASLPLAGQMFASANGDLKLEFRDRSRVYVSIFGEMQEAKWEQDGNRVIIRLPTANRVLERRGAYLEGDDVRLAPVKKN